MKKPLCFYLTYCWLVMGMFATSNADQSAVELKPRDGARIVEQHATIMGTDISILIMGEDIRKANDGIQMGFEEIRRIEALMTDWRDSPFERINQAAGIAPVVVDDEILFLIRESIKVSRLTQGSFDISYAGAGKLWDFKRRPPVLPEANEIRRSLEKIGYGKIEIDPEAKTVYLPQPGMRIGLGGIAKGYAVDRVVQKFKDKGYRNFAVNAGGDLTVRGTKQGDLWWVGIRHPRNTTENIALLPISNGSVVTSGDSERFFIVDGVRYSHILNPKTGYPATKSQSVTIISKHAYLADAFATGVFVMGPIDGMKLIESQRHLEGLIVGADGTIHVSSGLQKQRKPGLNTL